MTENNKYYISEVGYLNLLKDTLQYGEKRESRNGIVISRFGCIINFQNIQKDFPLFTTKKMFLRGIIEELLWFLRGSVNANELKNIGVHIWDGNSSKEYLEKIGLSHYEEGELGPVYGWQWRKFGKQYNEENSSNGIDQIRYVLEELLKSDNSRRAVLSAWNPVDIHKMALPPCHILYTFYKSSKGLSCHLTMRSSDLFLGLPFNIASTALLTMIISHILHMDSCDITLSLCDSHIYMEHMDAINMQLKNEIYDSPIMKILKERPLLDSSIEEKLNWIETLKYEDFQLIDYKSNGNIKAEMK